jgi:hypothetical protein
MIRQKQSLVHKVPSGVAILSHVGGVAAIALHTQMCVCIYLANMGRQGILVFYQWKKKKWESPPSIMVTRNPNWSQRSGMETGCVKGRY